MNTLSQRSIELFIDRKDKRETPTKWVGQQIICTD